jgi:type II secretory pathway pseudopilin PulG
MDKPVKIKRCHLRWLPMPDRACGGAAFTLLEVIGLVAVIAILAAVLIPRVMSVIGRGKVSATAQSLGGLQGAIAEYAARSNALPWRLGYDTTNAPTLGGRFDADLLRAGLIERLFVSSIGSQTPQATSGFGCAPSATPQAVTPLLQRPHVRSAPGGAVSLLPVATAITDVNFDLDRNGTGDFTTAQTVAYAYLPEVNVTEAAQLDQLLDGDLMTTGAADSTGRCLRSALSANNTVTVYVYLAHY